MGLDLESGFSAAGGHHLLALLSNPNCELPFQETMLWITVCRIRMSRPSSDLLSPHFLHSILVRMISTFLSTAKSHATTPFFLHFSRYRSRKEITVTSGLGLRIDLVLRLTTVELRIPVLICLEVEMELVFHVGALVDQLAHTH